MGALEKTQLDTANKLTAKSAALSNRLVLEAVLVGGLGLAAVAASVFLLVWFGRKVTRDLGGLNDSVREMADERLPRVVEQLRRGDDVDVAAESPPPATSSIQEVSRIAESFGTVQAAAVSAAVDQARLRKGVNQVFLNISMRNQSLLHRQLGMLDSMERRTSEPGALADLFRLDHLTTRMRRHAEGLIILSGSVPGRGWRDPVPVVDILRAAVAEVEDYVRVDVTSDSDDLVAGNAVSDVIHLIAELIENAAAFSPPNTRIEVRAERVGTGLVAEVEDRGLGMSPDELDDINARLASPPEFDPAHSDQLGLFVVSRLAARHAIKVSLRRSVYGGTMAVVLMPFGVVVRQEEARRAAPPWAGRPAEDGPRSLTGRHRLPPPPDVEAGSAGLAGRVPARVRGTGRRNGRWHRGRPGRSRCRPRPRRPARLRRCPRPWRRRRRSRRRHRPASPASGVGAGPASPASGSHLGMPIRVPQASMAPQLRDQRDADPQDPQDPQGLQAAEDDVPWFGARSPEATRSMLTMMQQGWRRGRMDDLDDPEGVPGTGN